MSTPPPVAERPLPSLFRVAWLVVAFALRRTSNRLAALRRKKNAAPNTRTATARKASTGGFLIVVFSSMFLFSSTSQAYRLVSNLARLMRDQDSGPLDFAANAGIWYGSGPESPMLVPLGLATLLLSASVIMIAVAGTSQDLAKVEASFEWWFTFPIPARGLLLARVIEVAFANPFAWLVLTPFFSVTFACAGFSWLGLPLGLLCTVYVGLIAGCLRIVTETALRTWLSLRNVARLQAVLSVLSSLPLVVVFATTSPEWLEKFVRFAEAWPRFALINVLSPIAIAAGGARACQAALACTAFALGAVALATHFGSWVLRDGLLTSTGPNQGRRGRPLPSADRRRSPFGPLVQKELRLLFRDRTLFSQTFVVPGVVLAIQLLMNHGVSRALTESPRHAAGIAFGVAAYALATGACNTLAVEVPVIWLYLTIPKRLDRLLIDKAIFWSGLGSLMALAVYGCAAVMGHWNPLGGAAMFALVLVGVTLNAFIATGIGVLGTQALESDARRRIPVAMTYLYMVLGSTFAYALYAPSAWAKFAQVILSSLLAYALWQKVRDHAPFLLDPNEKPAPNLAVADGVIASLAFFILQGLLSLWFRSLDYSSGASLLFAFTLAGVLAGAVILISLWHSGVPNLLSAVGLRMPERGLMRGVLTGVTTGLACGLLAKVYLGLVEHVDFLRRLRDETVSLPSGSGLSPWFALLAIVAAPVFEEFIFRGVLFGGFRRSFGALAAAAASAAVFAIVHPAIASAPVFVLGFAAALIYERERSLLVPMAAHMTYNALVVGLALRSS
ncbi:MAG: type II CAAX endopeptidase family protein [Pseudomonadota bacterium]